MPKSSRKRTPDPFPQPPVGLFVLGRMTLGENADAVALDARLTHAYSIARQLVDDTPAAEDFERAAAKNQRRNIEALIPDEWRPKLSDALDCAEFDGEGRGFALGFATAYYMLVEMHARPGGAR